MNFETPLIEKREELRTIDLSERFSVDPSSDEIIRVLRREENIRVVICVRWKDVQTVRQLKAYLERRRPEGQKRDFTVRATRDEYEQDVNAFESGVKWEEIQE